MKSLALKILLGVVLLVIPAFTALSIAARTTQEVLALTATQGIMFVWLSFFEALGFEVGLVSLFFVLPSVKKVDKVLSRNLKIIYFPLLWMLMSWWPHDYAHLHNNRGTWGLLYIEYGFHLTSIVAGLVVIYGLSSLIQNVSDRRTISQTKNPLR